jgi:uncharacterized protein (UPF0332 family)
MGLADDLLILAGHLANPSTNHPEQAWLRRSVSTSYYALFHLLVGDSAQCWNGSAAARVGLERAFGHDNMKRVSQTVSQGSWRGWSDPSPTVPAELKSVAKAFVRLQEERHQADYNNAKIWTQTEVRDQLDIAQVAFRNWRKIQSSAAANEYSLSLLIGRKRE